MLTQELIAENDRAKKKNYISCKKIAVYRKGLKKTEKGYQAASVRSFFVFEKEDGLIFNFREKRGQGLFVNIVSFKLKAAKNKAGEIKFRLYRFTGETVQTVSPNKMRAVIEMISSHDGFAKVHKRRLLSSVRAFAKKQGVSTKYLSDDPVDLVIQLCYPGTRNFEHLTLRGISTGKFLLDDPAKLALKTNGKLSRKLVYQAIKLNPLGAQFLLRIAKYIRVHRSLDEAQKFLKGIIDINGGARLFDAAFCDYRIAKERRPQDFTENTLKILGPVSTDNILRFFAGHRLFFFTDSISMIRELNANQGFDFTAIRYSTLEELHDQLVAMTGRRRRGGKAVFQFTHYDFSPSSLPMKTCQALAEKFNRDADEYKIVYASNTLDLQTQAESMKNCAFFYRDRINLGEYIVFCVQKKDEAGVFRDKYMFGYRVYRAHREDGRHYITLDQAVGKCNATIDEKVFKMLAKKIDECLESAAAVSAA